VKSVSRDRSDQVFLGGRVDPRGPWPSLRRWSATDEAFRVEPVGDFEGRGSTLDDLVDVADVHAHRGHHRDARVPMLAVVPLEESLAEGAYIRYRAEALGQLGSVLERLEPSFGVRVVVLDVRPTVSLGDAEVSEQESDVLRRHRRASICVDRELAALDVLLLDRLLDQSRGKGSALAWGNEPSDDAAAVDVEDHVQVEVVPLGRNFQLRDVPRPQWIRRRCEELGLRVDRMAKLIAALADLASVIEDAVHRALRAEVAALVEQSRMDSRNGCVRKAFAVQLIEDESAFSGLKRSWRDRGRANLVVGARRRARDSGSGAVPSRAGEPGRGASLFDAEVLACLRDGDHESSSSSSCCFRGIPSNSCTFFGTR